ncbi:VCBS repeat-containing protein [Kribbella sp. NPDC049584]|uniref:FG-GAP repeat domain-containing protein n=1 Tax=Kribbella sp. NPDC049584 TaxID=3154833 RepID=UPI00344915A6
MAGDFNGDHKTDIAIVNHDANAGWHTIPLALSTGNGAFTVSNQESGSFAFWASGSRSNPVLGDFNGDGRLDIALINNDPNSGWFTIPVAFGHTNGIFTVTNSGVPNFPAWSRDPDARAIAEDLNADGKTDIALTGGRSWNFIPTARSNGDGTFTVTNPTSGAFADATKFSVIIF